jgi:hypothetical protein
MFLVGTRIELYSQKLQKTLLFTWVTNGMVDSSWQNLTDTCSLTFAKRLFYQGTKLQDLLSAGDKVLVKTGYDGQLTEEFAGYLVRFNAKVPLTMFFEDSMWLLKKGNITKQFGATANLQDVINHLVSYYNSQFNAGLTSVVENAELGSFSVKDMSGARILQKLKETYGLYSYFRGNTLYSGFAYQIKDTKPSTVRYRFNYNIISDNLEYRVAEDASIKVKAISFSLKNKKTIATAGDPKGEIHTLHLPIGLSQAEVQKQADNELKRVRYDGYSGSFVGFHRPITRHGDIVEVIDYEFPEREGRFLVDRVVTTFGVNGIRRIIEPGIKA